MKILFVGGGNMAAALIGGLIARGHQPADIRVVEIVPEARERLAAKYGVTCLSVLEAPPVREEIVVFAVKPQQLKEAAKSSALVKDENLVISIAAGVTLNALSQMLGGHTRLIRAMPNTPALIGSGVTGLYPAAESVTREDRKNAQSIMGSVGTVIWVHSQDDMDAVTAVSGSGPAYVFYFIEALDQAARELGLPTESARTLALETFTGAVRLAVESSEPAALLRERVTSKGGTTERALASMARDGVKEAIIRAVHEAYRRSRELGEAFDKS